MSQNHSSAPLVSLEHLTPGAEVLIVTNLWPHRDNDRYGIFVYRQVQSLLALGLKCDVVFVHGYRAKRAYLFAAAKLTWLSARRGPAYRVVHSHGGELVPFARFYLRAPLVASYLGEDLLGTPDDNGRVTGFRRLRAGLVRQTSRVVASSIVKSAGMKRTLPASRQPRAHVIPNGVNRALFSPRSREDARRRLGWPSTEKVVLFAADPANPRKRFALAQDACAKVESRVANLRLRVAYPVSPDEMPLHMSAANCLIVASAVEGSPNVVKEALAVNLPVVTVDVGDAAEICRDIASAVVCAADPAALAAGIERFLTEPPPADGRTRTAWLSEDQIAARLLSVYRSFGVTSAAVRSWPSTTKASVS
jgi:glycosyltransferase involved in cell wall biosynthesis